VRETTMKWAALGAPGLDVSALLVAKRRRLRQRGIELFQRCQFFVIVERLAFIH
jgi:hypothetical protein